jgi:hypothetical protein
LSGRVHYGHGVSLLVVLLYGWYQWFGWNGSLFSGHVLFLRCLMVPASWAEPAGDSKV